MKLILRKLAYIFAVLGGLVALATGVMVTSSVVKRYITTKPIDGDVELVQMAIALSISLCIAWCQLKGANIIVDFFTQRVSERKTRVLDGIGSIMLAIMYGMLAWRTTVGAMAVYSARETSMTLELPSWWAYASLAPGLALAGAIALVQAYMHFQRQDMALLHGDTKAASL